MEYSMFEAIAKAIDELKAEADRVAGGAKVVRTITCGELQNILDYTRKATKRLKSVVVEDSFGCYLASRLEKAENEVNYIRSLQEVL